MCYSQFKYLHKGNKIMKGFQEKFGISTQNLSIGYEKHIVLENINLSAEYGSVLGIFGENGSGKTTLIRTLQTVIPKISGNAQIGGFELNKENYSAIRKICGSVFQVSDHDKGFPVLCKEVVMMARYGRKKIVEKIDQKDLNIVTNAMKKTGILDLAEKPYSLVSGGERQRVNLAQALALEPKILFLDEPNTFLDVEAENTLIGLIKQLSTDGITIILVSHSNHFMKQVANNVAIIEDNTIKKVLDISEFSEKYS